MRLTPIFTCLMLAGLASINASSVWPSGAAGNSGGITTQTNTGSCFAGRMVTITGQANNLPVPTYCPAGSTDPLCPPNDEQRFDGPAVQGHFRNQPPGFPMVDARTSTFSCVDARGDDPMLGTPGGDLSELMNAAMAIAKLTTSSTSGTGSTAVNNLQQIADDVFDFFTASVATSSRPLYFHTDDASLRRMFIYLAGAGGLATKPTSMPFQGPLSSADRERWLSALIMPEHNGCGHIRLQLNPSFQQFYSVNKPVAAVENCQGVATANCISSAVLARRVIRKFFQYWWFTSSSSSERRRISFAVDGILAGPLLGKAVAAISNSYAGSSQSTCRHHAPLVRPSFGASKVFVYHGDAVATWRAHVTNLNGFRNVLTKWGVPQSTQTARDTFLKVWSDIAGMQLGATLTHLAPANNIGVFGVSVPVSTSSSVSAQVSEQAFEQSVSLEAGAAAAADAEPVPSTETVEAVAELPVPVEPVAAAAAAVDVPVDTEVATAATAPGAVGP